jgi:glycosyltransferase involved in cell wall biosynthesis
MSQPFSMVMCSNFWSHHTVPLASCLAEIMGPGHFHLAVHEDVTQERLTMGWGSPARYPWFVEFHGTPRDKERYLELLREADVLAGWCPYELMRTRIATGKLTLFGSERMLKKPYHRLRMLNPRYALGFHRFRSMVNHSHVHALAVGHYAPTDLKTIRAFGDRIWRWGYFVDVPSQLPAKKVAGPVKVLWLGRLLALKRVDTLLRALARIQNQDSWSECLIVGEGPESERLQSMARRLGLDKKRVQFLPSVPFQEVRGLMRACDICVLSSNRHEGWGAVAGEAMAEGCVLVANRSAGASLELVVDNETGLLFHDGDDKELARVLARVCEDAGLRHHLRQNAWQMMKTLWDPHVGAERLVALSSGLLSFGPLPHYAEGPCARVSPVQ